MATGDLVDILRPLAFSPQNGPYPIPLLAAAGDLYGLPLPKSDTVAYEAVFRVPVNGTPLSTGLTFGLMMVDSPTDGDPGKVVHLGVTIKKLVSGTDDVVEADAAATEQTIDVTTASTSGVEVATDLAIANANLDSAAAGSYLQIKIRRIGSNTADTHKGRVVLLGVSVKDT